MSKIKDLAKDLIKPLAALQHLQAEEKREIADYYARYKQQQQFNEMNKLPQKNYDAGNITATNLKNAKMLPPFPENIVRDIKEIESFISDTGIDMDMFFQETEHPYVVIKQENPWDQTPPRPESYYKLFLSSKPLRGVLIVSTRWGKWKPFFSDSDSYPVPTGFGEYAPVPTREYHQWWLALDVALSPTEIRHIELNKSLGRNGLRGHALSATLREYYKINLRSKKPNHTGGKT